MASEKAKGRQPRIDLTKMEVIVSFAPQRVHDWNTLWTLLLIDDRATPAKPVKET